MGNTRSKGGTLVELLLAMSIVGLAISAAMPAFLALQRRSAVRSAAGEIRSVFRMCRSRAIARGTSQGVKFTLASGEWNYALYEDGNGNGVRNADIASGTDALTDAPQRVLLGSRFVSIRLPATAIVDPDGDTLQPWKPAVQFNKSAIASFSPLGAGTPGSIYLTSGDDVYAVRVSGASGKVTVLRYNRLKKKWAASW